MQILTKFNRFFGFTPTESKVVLFLIITFVIGSAVKLYKVYFPPSLANRFDYSEAEKEFAQRSKGIDSIEGAFDRANSKSFGTKKGASSSSPRSSKGTRSGVVININTASKKELMQLPGVGEVMAERILLHREEKGEFKSVEDLKHIKGIGKKIYEKLRPMVKVE